MESALALQLFAAAFEKCADKKTDQSWPVTIIQTSTIPRW